MTDDELNAAVEKEKMINRASVTVGMFVRILRDDFKVEKDRVLEAVAWAWDNVSKGE